ncbi:ring-hydroxylating dioxygenase subunit beta [Aliidongia dinghuensis]|uniref:Ring-hydroxylating dioxygenase subunit beta n=1 Tax=Aliidongia dinghuensis TaxID=1867774 RepID=A0A8J2Z0A0_9PROT|nr:aromatic-ring-hydroxylating dioxygenase subunit beta [Aliidongia dinghuensis]GGF49478.1 ring-hydroxylating dioxygenase subunit beta [Aliidongia dinghuensis]
MSALNPAGVRSLPDYQEFLYHEAALLDEWRLTEWLNLFAEDAVYEVPTAASAPDVSSDRDLFYIADDHVRLKHRVERLLKVGAHSEWPRSTGTRIVSNVRIVGKRDDGVDVRAAFVTYRSKNDITDTYFGHQHYRISEIDGALRIREKRVFLAMTSLRPHGRVSIIL